MQKRQEGEPRAPKPTAAETSARVSEVYELLLMGANRPHILQYGSKKWGIVDRAIDDLISKATHLLKAELSEDNTITIQQHVRRQHQLRFRAYAAGRYDLCLLIDQDLAKLQGLYPSEKHDLTLYRPRPIGWRPIQDAFRHPAIAPNPGVSATNGHSGTMESPPNGKKAI